MHEAQSDLPRMAASFSPRYFTTPAFPSRLPFMISISMMIMVHATWRYFMPGSRGDYRMQWGTGIINNTHISSLREKQTLINVLKARFDAMSVLL